MEILQFWWVAVVLIVLVAVFIELVKSKNRQKRKVERQRQYQRDESTIAGFFRKLDSREIRSYMSLPSFADRLAWLKLNYLEFMEVVERRYAQSDIDGTIAYNIDGRLINDKIRSDYSTSVRVLRNTAIAMSLNEYQAILDKENGERQKRLAEIAKEQVARQAREAATLKAQQRSAKSYWKSLSREQKANFKRARGKTARRNALPATSSDYSVDVLYPLIMAMNFSNINTNSTQSIDYCETSTSSHSSGGYSSGGYSDSGSSWSGGSSSYSDGGSSSSSSDSGGGGGGGGE